MKDRISRGSCARITVELSSVCQHRVRSRRDAKSTAPAASGGAAHCGDKASGWVRRRETAHWMPAIHRMRTRHCVQQPPAQPQARRRRGGRIPRSRSDLGHRQLCQGKLAEAAGISSFDARVAEERANARPCPIALTTRRGGSSGGTRRNRQRCPKVTSEPPAVRPSGSCSFTRTHLVPVAEAERCPLPGLRTDPCTGEF
jgi:hypothetical protein